MILLSSFSEAFVCGAHTGQSDETHSPEELMGLRLKRTFNNDLRVDEAKSRRTLNERGFEYAARIFLGPTLERQDARREYGEVRVQAIGRVVDDTLFVVYTDRGDARHIISARAD
jgi:uncharacterized DUF497 family protein